MLNLNIPKYQSVHHQILVPKYKPFATGGGNASFSVTPRLISVRRHKNVHIRRRSSAVKAVQTELKKSTESKKSTTTEEVKAIITVQQNVGRILTELVLSPGLDDVSDVLCGTLLIELIAAEADPDTGLEKSTIKPYARKKDSKDDNETYYEFDFKVPSDFGEIGAITIENKHHKEKFVKNVVIDGISGRLITVTCNSWVHSKSDDEKPRIFFVDKSYLPSQTPSGLTRYREKELQSLRGDGTGERKDFERIYDYDVYNDLGDPDGSDDLERPVLGGETHPYPRRCRTGRPRSEKDPLFETRSSEVYVPRDEEFSEVKRLTFVAKAAYSALPSILKQPFIMDSDLGFPNFTAIDTLFNDGIELPESNSSGFLANILKTIGKVIDIGDNILRFETPEMIDRDRFSWFRDEEFARQTLAGLNPCTIKLVTEWPLKSKLDPEVYGPAESAITKEMVEQEIGAFTTLEKALDQKKLFILDYHDLLLPYVSKVRQLKGTTLYGSRTLFFLTPSGTLRPLAIELTRPVIDGKPQWRQVFQPHWDATGLWLWRLAKAQVLAHDSGVHQLISHWLRTHCCVEPYIIATNRQLSALHPIYKLLHPHLRYTMKINALAREFLINGDGVIEKAFWPGKYSMELSSVAYDQLWQFDLQALPTELINRGMAVEDPTAPHGLKLTIEDYPYANDGLLLWDAIKKWVTDYVTRYYPKPNLVKSDSELQSWWTEIRTVGHGDKKDEPWWPVLETPDDLIGILTNIIWTASVHHSAVNFGQYDFAAYFPNRPTIARTKMPTEDPNDTEKAQFVERPEAFLLSCFPSQYQATTVMAALDVLSNHSPDEEYLGEKFPDYWQGDKIITAAFEQFSGRMKEIEGIIDARNIDPKLKNRFGAGLVPYELLKPFSKPGVTGQGVPNSISI